jgi:sec-independent protein translocase protein TatA
MSLFLFLTPTPVQVVIVLVLGVLFFGKNLPQVARQIGSALMEFKKGLNEFKDITNLQSKGKGGSLRSRVQEADEAVTETFKSTGTKFEPPVEVSGL